MTRDHQHNPDPNVNAHRIVQESTRDPGPQRARPASAAQIQAQAKQAAAEIESAEFEAAWKKWSASIQRVDERGWTLLRAAFEAGFEAGRG